MSTTKLLGFASCSAFMLQYDRAYLGRAHPRTTTGKLIDRVRQNNMAATTEIVAKVDVDRSEVDCLVEPIRVALLDAEIENHDENRCPVVHDTDQATTDSARSADLGLSRSSSRPQEPARSSSSELPLDLFEPPPRCAEHPGTSWCLPGLSRTRSQLNGHLGGPLGHRPCRGVLPAGAEV